jgi:Ca2+-binding RTX toxin-like protein
VSVKSPSGATLIGANLRVSEGTSSVTVTNPFPQLMTVVDVVVDGGIGNDTLLGGDHNDVVNGSVGDDVLDGQGGSADTLAGGEGDETVVGSPNEIDEAFVLSAKVLAALDVCGPRLRWWTIHLP